LVLAQFLVFKVNLNIHIVRLGLAQATEYIIMEVVGNMRIFAKGKGDAYGGKEKNYLAG